MASTSHQRKQKRQSPLKPRRTTRHKTSASNTALATTNQTTRAGIVTPTVIREGVERRLTNEELDLLKRTVARGTSPDQFSLFLWHCRKHHLDPVAKEAYCVLFNNDKHHQDFECPGLPYCRLPASGTGIWHPGKDMVIMVGIGGLMGLAARTHPDYGSVDAPEFTWFADKRTPAGRRIPESCTVRMWKKGADRPSSATLFWDEFAPVDLKESKAKFWNNMPANQLAKCTKAQCTKTAYPDLTDIYIPEEMAQKMSMLTKEGREITIAPPDVGEVAKARAALRDAKSPEEAKTAQEAFRKAQAGGKPPDKIPVYSIEGDRIS